MEKEFIPFELAVKLKALGFDKPCFGYYDHQIKELDTISSDVCERLCKHDTHIKAPTFSQSFKWFREKHGLIGQPIPLSTSYPGKVTHYGWSIVSNQNSNDWENEDDGFKTYEDAEIECLKKLIEIVKSK